LPLVLRRSDEEKQFVDALVSKQTVITAIENAKGRLAKLRGETEEIAKEDDGAVGKAFRKLSRVKKERAAAKEGPSARVEKASEKFEAVMSSIRLQSKQLKLDL
jgi:hypothetical protein